MRSPEVLLFDVNETLSDLSGMVQRFTDVGAPGHLAATWFAGVLRDGFALAVGGTSAPFAAVAAAGLRGLLTGLPLDRALEDAVTHVLAGFDQLDVHPDVPDGIRALADRGLRLVTLSNGATQVAAGLLDRAGVAERFERLLSVEAAGVWKPAAGAYAHALEQCGVEAAAAMLVAVHPWDVDGAGRAGLATVWLNRNGGPYPDHFRRPDLEVAALGDLAALLG